MSDDRPRGTLADERQRTQYGIEPRIIRAPNTDGYCIIANAVFGLHLPRWIPQPHTLALTEIGTELRFENNGFARHGDISAAVNINKVIAIVDTLHKFIAAECGFIPLDAHLLRTLGEIIARMTAKNFEAVIADGVRLDNVFKTIRTLALVLNLLYTPVPQRHLAAMPL